MEKGDFYSSRVSFMVLISLARVKLSVEVRISKRPIFWTNGETRDNGINRDKAWMCVKKKRHREKR